MARIRTIKPELLRGDVLERFELDLAFENPGAYVVRVPLTPDRNQRQRPLKGGELKPLRGSHPAVLQRVTHTQQAILPGELPSPRICRSPVMQVPAELILNLLKNGQIDGIQSDTHTRRVTRDAVSGAVERRDVDASLAPEEPAELCVPNLVSHGDNHTTTED